MMLFALLSACLASSSLVVSAEETNAIPPLDGGSLTTCIDDSDCASLGDGSAYRCFMYICYPWKDDSVLDDSQKRRTCRRDNECDNGQECFRHHDKRNVHRGLCFAQIEYCEDNDLSACEADFGCCGGYCCEQEYYKQFTDLPCSSHLGCQDLGLGQYCCPRDNSTSICCDTDPNPAPPTQAPSTSDNGAANHDSQKLLMLALLPAVVLKQLM